MKRSLFLVAACALAALATPAAAQDVAITDVTLAVGDGSEPIENGSIVVRGGKVVFAGHAEDMPAVPSAIVVDGAGRWVTPGLVLAMTDLALYDVGAVSQSNDKSASKSRFNAALDVTPAVNPASQHVAVARTGGLTRALVTPAHAGSLFAGQGAVIDLGADMDAVTSPRVFQLVDLGEGGAKLAGGSRTAAHAELDNALREARAYAAGRWQGEDAMLPRADAKALGPVVSGEQKLFVEVERASDILAVLALKGDFPRLDLVLVGVSEGWLVADRIAAAGVPVIADPLDDLPTKFEQLAATQSNIGRMVDAGVLVALGRMSDGGDSQPRNLRQHAGNLVGLQKVPGASGLTWGEALAAITSVPARIAGMEGILGSLSIGSAGDLVVWDGDPLEVSSAPVAMFIDGIQQPLESRHTRLRERYRDLDESDLPKAYDW